MTSAFPLLGRSKRALPRLFSRPTLLSSWIVAKLFCLALLPLQASDEFTFFLKQHCVDCHSEDEPDGDLDLSGLTSKSSSDVDLLENIFQKIASGEMPPEDAAPLPRETRNQISIWLKTKIRQMGRIPEWEQKLMFPEYGNHIDHEQLFDGSIKELPWSPARLWKKSPYIFDSMVLRGIGFRPGRYGRPPANLEKVKQPFTIEDKAGILDFSAVRYADTATLGTMIRNAEVIVDKHLAGAMMELEEKTNGPLPMDQWPKDRKGKPVKPRFPKTVDEFRQIILEEKTVSDEALDAAIEKMHQLLIEKTATVASKTKLKRLARDCIQQAGNAEGLRMTLVAIAISPEAIYRSELGQGPEDEHGRQLLAPIELAYAIAYALTDQKPDDQLLTAAVGGTLANRDDVRREVTRIWDDPETDKPRILRFFREYFGYHNAPKVFKDAARFKGDYRQVPAHLVEDCDTLVNYIVKQDKQVLAELLTTEKYFVAHDGDNEKNRKSVESLRQFYEYLKDKDWKSFPYQTPKEHKAKIVSIDRMFTHANGNVVKRWMNYLTMCAEKGLTPIPMMSNRDFIQLYNLSDKTFSFPPEQPFPLAPGKRAGILMHPAWLISHSLNLDNDPVRRGKWIRERLLAGTVPELPITVDASIPESPDHTLRERFAVTREAACWRCHVKMNPLGMPFELYDDFGKYRMAEALHTKGKKRTKPVDSTGVLDGTFDELLDGTVDDPLDLMKRLAQSTRVRQSFVRHAFRYWMGRNEMLSDSRTLIEADHAYTENNGSFKALVISLLTSDSFLYRKQINRDEIKSKNPSSRKAE